MLKVIRKDLIMNRTALVANLFIMAGFLFHVLMGRGRSCRDLRLLRGHHDGFCPGHGRDPGRQIQSHGPGVQSPCDPGDHRPIPLLLAVGSSVLGVLLAFSVGVFRSHVPTWRSRTLPSRVVLQALSVTTLVDRPPSPVHPSFRCLWPHPGFGGFPGPGHLGPDSGEDRPDLQPTSSLIESIVGLVRDLYVRLGSGGFYLLLLLFLCGVFWRFVWPSRFGYFEGGSSRDGTRGDGSRGPEC